MEEKSVQKELGGNESEQAKQIQKEIADLIKTRDEIAKQITGGVYRLQRVSVDPNNISQAEVVSTLDSGKEFEQFKILGQSKFQWHFKKTDKDKTIYDCTFVCTVGELPVIVGENETFSFTVSGTAEGTVGPNIWAQARVSVNSASKTYEGQPGDKVCWVGNAKGGTKTACQGAYRITPDPTFAGFNVSVGMMSMGSPDAAEYFYQLEPIANILK